MLNLRNTGDARLFGSNAALRILRICSGLMRTRLYLKELEEFVPALNSVLLDTSKVASTSSSL